LSEIGVIGMHEVDCSHPYWGQSIQCKQRQQQQQQQQKPQSRPEAKPQQKTQGKPREKKPRAKDGFDDELANRHVKIVMLANGRTEELKGTIVDIAKYWLKVLDDNGTVRYINKAFVVSIIPE